MALEKSIAISLLITKVTFKGIISSRLADVRTELLRFKVLCLLSKPRYPLIRKTIKVILKF